MSALGDKIRSWAATQPAPAPRPPPVAWTPSFLRPPVGPSADLDRILALPRRPWPVVPTEAEVTEINTDLRRPGATRSLWPIQVAALLDARRLGGLVAPMGVGAGKTDTSLLLPVVMQSKVAVLMVPPSLRAKLLEHEYPHLATQYRLPNIAGGDVFYPDATGLLYVVSYSQLSSAKSADILDRIRPDLIVLDEGHQLARSGASRTKRFLRYFRANPQTRLCVLSGSITRRSIKDYAHLLRFALRDKSPAPLHWPTLDEWAAALDSSDLPAPPGDLERLCAPGEDVRAAYGRRLVESYGVVATGKNYLPTSLVLNERKVRVPERVTRSLDDMRKTWCTPSGEEITDALSLARYASQLSAGLYLRWIWPRAEPLDVRLEWLEARKEWHQEIRQMLKGEGKQGLDSPFLLKTAAATGRWVSKTWARWADVEGLAKPETEAVWVDDFLAQDAAAWGRKHVGVIWYEHADLGPKIAELGGFPLYGGGPKASSAILKERGDRTIVASVDAHGEGKNLQCFRTQLVTTSSSSGKTWEQLLGRMHRPGQAADDVECNVYLHTPELRSALTSALRDAEYAEKMLKSAQKLKCATFTFVP